MSLPAAKADASTFKQPVFPGEKTLPRPREPTHCRAEIRPLSAEATTTLLLAVDLQPAFLDMIPGGARTLRRAAFAVAAAQGLGLPVAFTEQVPAKLGRTAPALLALAPGAPAFAKETFSALADEAIRAALFDERRIDHLLLCGIETPICIYQTALDARRAGIEVTLLSDAIGARRTDDAEVCLSALRAVGVNVIPSETVFYSLLGSARHPFFRDFTKLVKAHAEPSAT
jgi:nicotinamidase-related amidase